jgi:hypothetical protein
MVSRAVTGEYNADVFITLQGNNARTERRNFEAQPRQRVQARTRRNERVVRGLAGAYGMVSEVDRTAEIKGQEIYAVSLRLCIEQSGILAPALERHVIISPYASYSV